MTSFFCRLIWIKFRWHVDWCDMVKIETRSRIPTWRNVWANSMACYPRVTCHIAGCNNSILHIENRFSPYYIFFVFLMQFGLWRAVAFVSSPIHLLSTVSFTAYKTSFTTDIYYVSNCFYCHSPGETVMMLSAACQRWLCFLAIACCCHYIMN